MAVTIVFENGTRRDFPNARDVQPRGQAIILFSGGKKIFDSDGPVASVIVNGEEIPWPPD